MLKQFCRYFALLCCAVVGAGCFTSEQAIYDDEQVVSDPRLEGHYLNHNQDGKELASRWWIRPGDNPQDGPRRYEVRVTDGPASMKLVGALFRLKSGLYFDLFPAEDSGTWNKPGEPSESQLLHGFVFVRRHVIWKVEVKDSEIVYRAPAGKGLFAAARRSKLTIAPRSPGSFEVIVLPRSRKEAQQILEEIGDDPEVYNFEGRLVKKPKA